MISELKPYSKYKASGLSWLGPVPEHWEVRPAFGAFLPNHEKNTGMKEKLVLSLSYGRIIVKPAEKLRGLVPESFETYQIVDPGDIVLRTTDLQNDHTSLRVGMVRNRGIITSAYLALRTKSGVNPEFGFQFLNVWDSTKAIYGYGSGLRQNLDFSHFKRMPVALPPPAEQAVIVRFLNWANGRIERAVRSKRKVIALLNEQKQAIIHRAVTRGLDAEVALKPSGVPWLGDIPAHWEIRRAKYLLREIDERSKEGKETHLAMSQRLGLVPSNQVESAMRSASYAGAKLCKVGDLVLNRLKAHLGVFALANQGGVISPDYTVFRKCAEISMEYYESVLRSSACRRELRIRAKGLVEGFWRLYTDDFYDIRLPVPPLIEQQGIISDIAAKTAGLNIAVARSEQEIILFQEYRARLVADVVTGKLDVRDAAAKLANEIPVDTTSGEDLIEELESVDQEAIE